MKSRSHGMTLVELCVTIAIIGVLSGLLMPAIQAAREAARKTSCRNNLKQIGLGLQNYHSALGRLPPGCIEWRGARSPASFRQFAWSAFLLPYIEQQNLFQQINFSVPYDSPVNALAASTEVSTYQCPSAERPTNPRRGSTDYGGLHGETLVNRLTDDGTFLHERSLRFSDFSDGLSHTTCVSEDIGSPDREWINGRNVFVQSGGINDPRSWIGDNEIRSAHSGGAFLLFLDGHVRFYADTTSRKTLGSLITRANQDIPGD